MALRPPPDTLPAHEIREAHRLDEAALGAWLFEHVEGCPSGPAQVRQFKGGQSNPTYWIGIEGASGVPLELVLRKKPPGTLLPSAHAVEREYRILRALHGAGVPVPQAVALDEGADVIGTPFFVMRFVPGRIFWDPTLPAIGSHDRGAIYREYVATLAKLHRVDYVKVGLGDYGKVGGYVARQVERWSKQYEASRTSAIPAMESLMAWLRDNIPASDETTIIHGDYRIDNLMFAADEPRVLAVLDWELSTLGHPISDLAYACMGYHLNLPGRGGLLGVDLTSLGIPSQTELIATYCELAGRNLDSTMENFGYFMAFGFFRLAAIAQGVYMRSLQGNASSDSAGHFGAAVSMLAELGCNIKTPKNG